MIIGHGIDLIDARRVEKLLSLYPERFRRKYFTVQEIERADQITDPRACILYFAKRFAAKEAAAKALGFGFRGGITMQQVEIRRDDKTRRPILTLHGKALKAAEALAGEDKTLSFHLSLSDDPPYALASVILEAI
jgi:holo-[acyl-carrier protein] synthase